MTVSGVSDRQVGGDHYLDLEIQPWDVMQAWMTTEEYTGYIYGNVLKYLSRYKRKGNPGADLQKAQHYLEVLISLVEADPHLQSVSCEYDYE